MLIHLSDDLSSISGSDSSDEDTIDTIAIAQGKIFLKNANGSVFSMYKCLIAEKKVCLKCNIYWSFTYHYFRKN